MSCDQAMTYLHGYHGSHLRLSLCKRQEPGGTCHLQQELCSNFNSAVYFNKGFINGKVLQFIHQTCMHILTHTLETEMDKYIFGTVCGVC